MLKILIINELSIYFNSKTVLLHLFYHFQFCLPLQYSSGLLLLASEVLLIKNLSIFTFSPPRFQRSPPATTTTCQTTNKNKHRMTTTEFIFSPQKPVLKSWSRCAQYKPLKCSQENNSKTIRINRCVNLFWYPHSYFYFSNDSYFHFHTGWNVTPHFIGQ